MGRVHSVETMGALDGPGLRMVVFLSGCPLRCRFCHNPDTWNIFSGREVKSDEILKKALRLLPYFGKTGGVTLSGGEPFMQAGFALAILQKCKQNGIHTAVDTSGFYLTQTVKRALEFTDLVLLDIKHTSPTEYKRLTGMDISSSLGFLDYMKKIQKPLWIRQVIVPGITDSPQQVEAMLKLVSGANVLKVELLPYHTMGVEKWAKLGYDYPLAGVLPPANETMRSLDALVDSYYPKKPKEEKGHEH